MKNYQEYVGKEKIQGSVRKEKLTGIRWGGKNRGYVGKEKLTWICVRKSLRGYVGKKLQKYVGKESPTGIICNGKHNDRLARKNTQLYVGKEKHTTICWV